MRHYATLISLIVTLMFLWGCHARPATPLTAAAAVGDAEKVRALLAQGVDVNAVDSSGGTAIIWAAREGHVDTVEALLAAGADPDLPAGVNGWTPLMHAIHKNQKEAIQALVDGDADLEARMDSGGTALMMAAGYGYSDIVQILLDAGADPYAEDPDGNTALTAAVGGLPDIDRFTVGHCQASTVQALLERAPDLRLKETAWARMARLSAKWGHCSEVLSLLNPPDQPRSAP